MASNSHSDDTSLHRNKPAGCGLQRAPRLRSALLGQAPLCWLIINTVWWEQDAGIFLLHWVKVILSVSR